MDKRTKTWLSIVVAILAVLVMGGVAIVAGSVYFVYSHVRQAPAEEMQAGDRFAQVREQMANQQPLLEISDRDELVVHSAAEAPPSGGRVNTLRAMVYDPREERIVDVDIPFWLLRIMPSGRFSFMNRSGIDFDSDRIRVTVEDLEKRGPGLVLDHRDRRGARVLVWTE
jgi:hypothetical protein